MQLKYTYKMVILCREWFSAHNQDEYRLAVWNDRKSQQFPKARGKMKSLLVGLIKQEMKRKLQCFEAKL